MRALVLTLLLCCTCSAEPFTIKATEGPYDLYVLSTLDLLTNGQPDDLVITFGNAIGAIPESNFLDEFNSLNGVDYQGYTVEGINFDLISLAADVSHGPNHGITLWLNVSVNTVPEPSPLVMLFGTLFWRRNRAIRT